MKVWIGFPRAEELRAAQEADQRGERSLKEFWDRYKADVNAWAEAERLVRRYGRLRYVPPGAS